MFTAFFVNKLMWNGKEKHLKFAERLPKLFKLKDTRKVSPFSVWDARGIYMLNFKNHWSNSRGHGMS